MAREGGRERAKDTQQRLRRPDVSFINPYPWMSGIEAMVHLALEEHKVPFSWRYFDGEAPIFRELLINQGFHPEFTVKEQRLVIMVQGTFFGALPGILDKVALAKVALQEDGWFVVILWEPDIRTFGAWELLRKEFPAIGAVTGEVRPNPFAPFLNLLARRRKRGPGAQPKPRVDSVRTRQRSDGSERRRIRRGGRVTSDGGRRRVGSAAAVARGFKSR